MCLLQMWDVQGKRPLRHFSHYDYVALLAFSPQSAGMAVSPDFERVVFPDYRTDSTRDLVRFRPKTEIPSKIEQPKVACFSADGRLVIVGTTSGEVYPLEAGGGRG